MTMLLAFAQSARVHSHQDFQKRIWLNLANANLGILSLAEGLIPRQVKISNNGALAQFY
jgi:hypothetical protein